MDGEKGINYNNVKSTLDQHVETVNNNKNNDNNDDCTANDNGEEEENKDYMYSSGEYF